MDTLQCNASDIVHLSLDLIERERGVGFEEVGLQFWEGEFVGRLVLAVVTGVLLHTVIGEVDEQVTVVQAEQLRTGTSVPLLVEVPLQQSVHARHQQVTTHVEFTILIQQRVLYVLLYYHCVF